MIIRKVNLILFGLITVMIINSSCTHEAKNISEFPEICFTQEILPVFQNSCSMSDCHDVSSAESGYIYSDYSEIMKSIKPYDPAGSKAYQVLFSVWEEMMPPTNPLSQNDRTLIRLWIEQGALNTDCIDTTGTEPEINDSICFENDVLPIFLSSCALSDCHDDLTAEEDIILNSYNNIVNSEEEDLIIPGQPWESKIFKAITEDEADEMMPPPGYNPLNQNQIEIIYQWILEGALDIECAVVPCDTQNVTFYGTVWPTVQNNCLGCHSGLNPSGNVSLNGYSDIMLFVSNGKLVNAINGSPQMPPNNTLSDCTIRKIEIWIENGALDD